MKPRSAKSKFRAAFTKLPGRKEGLREQALRMLRTAGIGRPVAARTEHDYDVLAFAEKHGWVEAKHLTEAGLRELYPWAVETSFRQDRGIWEGICKHGIGHPIGALPKPGDGVHGCDACCATSISG